MRTAAVAAAVLLLSVPVELSQRDDARAFVDWGRAHHVPVAIDEHAASTRDLQSIRAAIGASRLVALGEPVHGAHEPLAFRNRLFRFLATESGFTAIALETGMPQAAAMQAFIDGAHGNASEVARRSFTWGFGDYAENAELLRWMRDFNRSHPSSRRLRIYGVDLSGSDEDTAATRMLGALTPALRWLRAVDSASADRLDSALAPSLAHLRHSPHSSMPALLQDRMSASIADLLATLAMYRTSSSASRKREEFDDAMRAALSARQVDSFWRSMPLPDSNIRGIPPGAWRPMTSRDGAMADNVLSALQAEGPAGKLFVFAHNVHVLNGALTGGVARAFAVPPSMMGQYLRGRVAREMFSIAVSTRTGDSSFKPTALPANGFDTALVRFDHRRFFVNLRSAGSKGAVAQWLEGARAFKVNLNQQIDIVPATAFDAFVFIDSLTPAKR